MDGGAPAKAPRRPSGAAGHNRVLVKRNGGGGGRRRNPLCKLMNRLLLACALALLAAAPLAAQPDIIGFDIQFGREYYDAGDSLFISIPAANSGTAPAPAFPAAVYLSDDRVVTPDDTLLARVTLPGVAPQMNTSAGVRVRLPPDLVRGAYYVLVHLDDPDTVAETDETNNRSIGRFTANRVFEGPDLIPANAENEDPVTEPGGRVTVEYEVINGGRADVGDFDAAFFLIAGTELTVPRAEWRLLERETLGGLESGERDSESEQFTIPANVAPGTYTLFLVLDDRNRIAERTEINNEFAMGLTVTGTTAGEPAPDVSALGLRASPNPAGASVEIAYTLAEAGPVRLAVYDALGRRVAVVSEGERGAGSHAETVDASGLPPGVYVARLAAPGGASSAQFTVVR